MLHVGKRVFYIKCEHSMHVLQPLPATMPLGMTLFFTSLEPVASQATRQQSINCSTSAASRVCD